MIASSGSTFLNSSGSISFTIGEGVAQTLSGGGKSLTQGFQQSYITVSLINETKTIDFAITVFPNPTTNDLTLKLIKETVMGLEYLLFDINGKLLSQKNLENTETVIPLSRFAQGYYILKVQERENEIKSFKIIKL